MAAAAAAAASADAAKPVRPEGLPDRFWDPEKGVKVEDVVKTAAEIEAKSAADAERAAKVPADAGEYKVAVDTAALAQKFGLKPEEVTVDEAHPLITPFRDFAKENGLTQEAFGKALTLFSDWQLGMQKQHASGVEQWKADENKKLGDHVARRGAVEQFLASKIGADDAKAFMGSLMDAKDIQVIEKLQAAISAQGGKAAPAGGGNTGDDPRQLTDEERKAMTPAERILFATTGQKAA